MHLKRQILLGQTRQISLWQERGSGRPMGEGQQEKSHCNDGPFHRGDLPGHSHHEVPVPHGRCVLDAALLRRPGLLPHEGVEAEHAYQEAQQGHLKKREAQTCECVSVCVMDHAPHSLATHILPPLTHFRPIPSPRQDHHLPSSLQSLHPTALYHSKEKCVRARVRGALSLSRSPNRNFVT